MIFILTDPGIGGTFLTWSLHFLAGHDDYFLARKNSTFLIPTSPLTKINSHEFIPNQPSTIDYFKKDLECLSTTSTDGFHTLYFHNFRGCTQSTTSPTAVAINTVKNISNNIVYLSLDKKHALYQCKYEGRTLITDEKSGKPYENFDKQHHGWINKYFLKDKQLWSALSLNKHWDYREFLALNVNPHDIVKMSDVSAFDFDHYYLDSFDLYNNFDCLVDDLFKYIDVKLDSNKLLEWINVYHKWQQLHTNRIQFVYYFDTIIDYILEGKYFDLKRLNLDIMQEAAIQRHMIYNHNLNFKTWQLEKFNNTQQLHSLLEPNIHPIN